MFQLCIRMHDLSNLLWAAESTEPAVFYLPEGSRAALMVECNGRGQLEVGPLP